MPNYDPDEILDLSIYSLLIRFQKIRINGSTTNCSHEIGPSELYSQKYGGT